jgi:O-antigen ligase
MKKNIISPNRDIILSFVLSLFAISLYFDLKYLILSTTLFLFTGAGFILYDIFGKKEKLQKPHPIVYCWMAVYLVRVVWLLVSTDIHYGLKWLDVCLPMLLFPLTFQYLSLSERAIKTALTFFVHFTLLFCVITLFIIAYHSITMPIDIKDWLHSPKDYSNLAFTLTNSHHPSFLCVIYLFALPAGLYLRRKYHTIAATEIAILAIVEATVIVFTGARVGIIIFTLLLSMMAIYSVSLKRKVITIGVIITILSIIAVMWSLSENQFIDRFKDPIREQLWEAAIASIKEEPLLGVGTGGMRAIIDTLKTTEIVGQTFSYPHNQYLGEVMHFGIIGAIPLFATLIYLLIMAIRQKNFLLLSLMAILFIFTITEMPFDLYRSINYFLFFISLLLFQKQKSLPA